MSKLLASVGLAGAVAVSACAVAPPSGPSVAVMPGPGKSFEAFQQDDFACRQFADQRIGYLSPGQAATQSAVGSAALGTAVGAAAGALIGAAAGNPAAGAAIGAGSGLLVGGASGANAAQYSGASVQQQYDIGYTQCMAAKGNNVPPIASAPVGYVGTPALVPAYPAYYPGYFGPSVAIGVGGGWGWGGWGGWGWGPRCCWGGWGGGWHGGWGGGHWYR